MNEMQYIVNICLLTQTDEEEVILIRDFNSFIPLMVAKFGTIINFCRAKQDALSIMHAEIF